MCRHGYSKAAFEETTLAEMGSMVIDINIRGVFATTQPALKHMKDGGRIIMIGSAVGERSAVAPGLVPYAWPRRELSRCSLRRYLQGREPGHQRSTTFSPGPIDTDLNPPSGDLGGTAEGCHGARPLWAR